MVKGRKSKNISGNVIKYIDSILVHRKGELSYEQTASGRAPPLLANVADEPVIAKVFVFICT